MRYLLPTAACIALALAGCATSQKKQPMTAQTMQKIMRDENTRTTEHLRMVAVENGEVSSQRGASILYPDYGRGFDPNHFTAAAMRNYGTKNATSKDFASGQPFRVDTYQSHDFYGSKPDSAAQHKYATADANTKGKYLIPNGEKAYGTKTAGTRESWDAHKLAPTRELADGRRLFLGREHDKLGKSSDPKELAKWQTGETVTYSDGQIEKVSTLKPLSVEDVRDLLNKSK